MTDLTASVDHIRWCAGEFAQAARGVAAAEPGGSASAAAALSPVFGVLGGDFVAAFAAAHGAHARGVAGLAQVLHGAGRTAAGIADAYALHERRQAASLGHEGAAL